MLQLGSICQCVCAWIFMSKYRFPNRLHFWFNSDENQMTYLLAWICVCRTFCFAAFTVSWTRNILIFSSDVLEDLILVTKSFLRVIFISCFWNLQLFHAYPWNKQDTTSFSGMNFISRMIQRYHISPSTSMTFRDP